MRMKESIQVSKKLAYLLRHSSLPDRNGWVKVKLLLDDLSVSRLYLALIINSDDKGRFEFSKDELSVRALYGHSIDIDLDLKSETPPTILYHGTAEKYLDSIMQEGLKPRKRKFVHLSETIEMAEQVGARHGISVVLAIDTNSMVSQGYNFYKAKIGVWLTEQIPVRFIKMSSL